MSNKERPSLAPEVISLERTPIPLVNSFLDSLRNKGICFKEEDFYFLSQELPELEFSYLMSLANRRAGDNTGILGHLVGVSHDPNHTENIVSRIGKEMLFELHKDPNHKTIIKLLNNEFVSKVNETTIIAIDNLAKETIKRIKGVACEAYFTNKPGQQTPEAIAFKAGNKQALESLIKENDNDIHKLLNRSYEKDLNNSVIKIAQAPIIPNLDITLLLNILPDQLNRNISLQTPEAGDPLGFVARINMAGSGPFRLLAERVKYIIEAMKISNHL